MSYFEWKDEYSIGIDEIDDQHRSLVDMIDRLHHSLELSQFQYHTLLNSVLNDLSDYIFNHFRTEEKYMTENEYNDIDAHRKEHKKFLIQMMEFQNKYTDGVKDIASGLLDFLKDWLNNHILNVDKKMGNFILKKKD